MGLDQTSVATRQAPLRQRYSELPAEAMITKRVRTTTPNLRDPFHSTVYPQNVAHPQTPYGIEWSLGIDEAVGGLHDAPNPGDMLCAALAACLEGTVLMIANLLRIELEELNVEVTGQVDVRGALAIDPSVPVGFQTIATNVRIRAVVGTPPRLVEQLCAASERLCIDLQTLRHGVNVEVAFDADPAAPLHPDPSEQVAKVSAPLSA
jgi:uncharacterized OsmC-like protein